MVTAAGLVTLGRRVASVFSEKNVSLMAAGIAYNALVSLAPLLILLVLVVSIVGGGLEERLIAATSESLPGPIAGVVVGVLSGGATATGASIVGLVVLLWGTLKIFRGLDTAFTEIYETDRDPSFLDQITDGLVVFVALVLSIVATIAVSTVFATLSDDIPFLGLLTPVVLVAGLVLAFFPMYYVFPDIDIAWRDVLPGTVFAAVGWALLQAVFQVYLIFRGGGTGNFFGGLLVLVTWLYFSGLVLLVGAVLNATIGGHVSGAPGGAGRETPRDERDRVTTTVLPGTELARHLRALQGHSDGEPGVSESTAGSRERDQAAGGETEDDVDGVLRTLRPVLSSDGDVEVVEWSSPDGGERETAVTFRWHPADQRPDD